MNLPETALSQLFLEFCNPRGWPPGLSTRYIEEAEPAWDNRKGGEELKAFCSGGNINHAGGREGGAQ